MKLIISKHLFENLWGLTPLQIPYGTFIIS